MVVVEATFAWDDVGSWTAVAKYWKQDGQGNSSNSPVTPLDSSNNIVFSNQNTHVALIGVKNLIVVQTGDAVLVCDRHEVENIKELVARIPPLLQ